MDRFLPFRCGRSYFCYRAPGASTRNDLTDTGSALAADRHQAQPRGQSDIGEHFQRSTLVMRQAFRYPDEHADHTVAASRSARRAIVTVDYHRRPRPGGCAAASVWSAACHGVVPLGLAHEVVRTLIASTDIRCRRVRARRRERLRVSAGA